MAAAKLSLSDSSGPTKFDDVTRRPAHSLQTLARERIVVQALKAWRSIQSGLKMDWLGWPFTYIPNLETKVSILLNKRVYFCSNNALLQAFRRHGIRQLQSYLISAPHFFNDLVLEMYRRDPNCIEVLLHPHLKTLEVNSKSLSLVLEYAYNLTKLGTLYLFFDINRLVTGT